MADITQGDLDKLQDDNADLRQKIEDEKSNLSRRQQQDSLSANKQTLLTEGDRLKAELEAIKASVKAQEKANSPQEQAKAAATTPPTTPVVTTKNEKE